MKRTEHTSKLTGSVGEHSERTRSKVNRYEYEFHHGRVRRKLSAGKAGSSASRSSRNFDVTSSGASHVSKGILREGGRLKAVRTTTAVAGSAGVGISSGIGVAAANAMAGTSFALGSTIIVPLVTGAVAAYVSMAVWDKLFYKGKCLSKTG